MLSDQHMEQLCLDWSRAGGYASAYTPERRDYQQVVLTGHLPVALRHNSG